MSILLRRAALPLLALAIASCWLTASLNDGVDSGAADASPDVRAPDSGQDGAIDAGLDARHDGASPPDAADAKEAATDSAIPSDAPCTGMTYMASVLSATPLAYWPLDEDGGTIAHDRTGNDHDGTYSTMGVTYGEPGIDGGGTSVLLNGTSGKIVVDDSTLEFKGTVPYSLEAWIQPTAITTDFEGILSNESQTDSGKLGYVMYLQEDAGIGFDRYQTTTSTPLTEAGVVSANAGWYHVVGVYDGKAMSIYVNGSSVAQRATSLTIEGGCTFAIGATHCGNSGWFQGYMAEVAVYGYALDATCIATHHNLGGK